MSNQHSFGPGSAEELLLQDASYRDLASNEPLVHWLQDIGNQAWTDALGTSDFGGRTPQEIGYVYNSRDGRRNEEQLLETLELAKHGHMVIARARDATDQAVIGYGAMINDVSSSKDNPVFNWAERFAKSHIFPHFPALAVEHAGVSTPYPYAKLAIVNVLPAYQNSGVGTRIIQRLCGNFRPGQVPTAYVYEENPQTLGYFEDYLGFKKTGHAVDGDGFVNEWLEDEPTPKIDRFGPGTRPPMQYRLTQRSIRELQAVIDSHTAELPVVRDF